MLINDFKNWLSVDKDLDNTETFVCFEKAYRIALPETYKNLVRFRDGGLLKKDIFIYNNEYRIDENCIARFLCWQQHTYEKYYIIDEINSPPEFFPKRLIPFAPDGGGNYICFDYRNCQKNPPVVFWHHEIEENDGIFRIANSFDEFLYNLKTTEEMM